MQRRWDVVFDAGRHWLVRFRQDQVIFFEGELAEAMYRLEEGVVRLQIDSRDGARQVISFLFPGSVFGACAGSHIATAEAVTPVAATYYPTTSVLEIAGQSSEAVASLWSEASVLTSELVQHSQQIGRLPAAERVLWFFDLMARRQGGNSYVQLPMSRRDVSDYLALSPETLSRTIRQLREEGRLRKDGHRSFTIARSRFARRWAEVSRSRTAPPRPPGRNARRLQGATERGASSVAVTK